MPGRLCCVVVEALKGNHHLNLEGFGGLSQPCRADRHGTPHLRRCSTPPSSQLWSLTASDPAHVGDPNIQAFLFPATHWCNSASTGVMHVEHGSLLGHPHPPDARPIDLTGKLTNTTTQGNTQQCLPDTRPCQISDSVGRPGSVSPASSTV